MTEPKRSAPRSHLYTKTGDDGSTGLYSGTRVGKEHPRIEAYGTVDELNACVGWARAAMKERSASNGSKDPHPGGRSVADADAREGFEVIERILGALQDRLFELGADLATPSGSKLESRVSRMSDADVLESERWIDEADAENEALRTFVLPGGCELACRLHVARTVSRRAERAMVALSRSEPVGDAAIKFINRVSDLLFALARRANRAAGVPDVPWTARPRA